MGDVAKEKVLAAPSCLGNSEVKRERRGKAEGLLKSKHRGKAPPETADDQETSSPAWGGREDARESEQEGEHRRWSRVSRGRGET